MMEEIVYRIIFKKLYSKQNNAFIEYIRSNFGFSKKQAEHILNSPPAILCDSPSKNIITAALKRLKDINAGVSVHKVIKDKRLPFYIDQLHLKWISKLLNMALRAGVDAAFLYVVVQPGNKEDHLTPLTGRENDIEKNFRESDSVYAIDDHKLLFFGFTTNETGLHILIPKIIKIVKNITHPNADVKIGEAIFPKDGYSFYELIHVIQGRIDTYTAPGEKPEPVSVKVKVQKKSQSNKIPAVQPYLINNIFNDARGLLFWKLITMDPELLWGGLRWLSIADQNFFCLRLPHDFPLAYKPLEKIKSQAASEKEIEAKKKIEHLITTMDVRTKLVEREKNQTAVILKLRRLESLLIIPSIALQIYGVAMDPKSEIDDIQKIIELDPVMTLKLLKLVNSSFYGFSQKISSVKEAAIILGTDEITDMVVGLSLSKSFKIPGLKGFIDSRMLWKHSVRTALIGKYLCRERQKFTEEGIFAAGILHDFGKLFLFKSFPDEYKKIIKLSRETDLPIYEFEEDIFGYNHGIVSGLIAKKWNLPESLIQAISFHHHPSSSKNHADLAAILGFANYLSSIENDDEPKKNTSLLKDHMDTLQSIFDDFTINAIKEEIKGARNFLENNSEIFSLFS